MSGTDSPNGAAGPGTPKTKRKTRKSWSKEENARFRQGVELYGRKDAKAIAKLVRTRNVTQVRSHVQSYFNKKQAEPARTVTPTRAGAGAGGVDPRPSPELPDTPGNSRETAVVTPIQTDSPAQTQSDSPAPPSQSGDSAKFVLAVINTKDSDAARTQGGQGPPKSPGITQKAGLLFQQVMTSFRRHTINAPGFGSVPAAWLVSEVAFALKKGFMSALSQEAPYAARSKREPQHDKPDAAVIWGGAYAKGAEALTLELLSDDRGTGERYVQVAGKSLRVDTQKSFKAGQYEEMLSRVAAARLTLSPVGQCLLLSYHGPHIIRGPDSEEQKFRRKCRYLRWLLLLARGLAELLGIPVVVGGDFNLDASDSEVRKRLGKATKDAELVRYAVNERRAHNVVDWLYLINPRNGRTRLVCEECVAVDPAQPYREKLAAERVTLHPNWFDHDALLAVLRLIVCR